MDTKTYQRLSARTAALLGNDTLDLLHMLLGMATELGELSDVYKRYIAYGKEIDLVNVKEELGDLMWYVSNFCTFTGISLGEVLEQNVNKLKVRYPDSFAVANAVNRDLERERMALESGVAEFPAKLSFDDTMPD